MIQSGHLAAAHGQAAGNRTGAGAQIENNVALAHTAVGEQAFEEGVREPGPMARVIAGSPAEIGSHRHPL